MISFSCWVKNVNLNMCQVWKTKLRGKSLLIDWDSAMISCNHMDAYRQCI